MKKPARFAEVNMSKTQGSFREHDNYANWHKQTQNMVEQKSRPTPRKSQGKIMISPGHSNKNKMNAPFKLNPQQINLAATKANYMSPDPKKTR